MANQDWQSNEFGNVDDAGKKRALDYKDDQSAFAEVVAAIIIDKEENLLGGAGSPIHITGAVTDEWTITELQTSTMTAGELTITCPANREYQVLSVAAAIYPIAGAGDRQAELEFRNADDRVFLEVRPGAVQAVTVTGFYNFAAGFPDHLTFRDTNHMMCPLGSTIFLKPNYDMHFWDNNEVSAADGFEMIAMVAERVVE